MGNNGNLFESIKERLAQLKRIKPKQMIRPALEIIGVILLFFSMYSYSLAEEGYDKLLQQYDDLYENYSTVVTQYDVLSSTYSDYKNKMEPYEEQAGIDEQAKQEQEAAAEQERIAQEQARLEQEQQEKQRLEELQKAMIYEGTYKVGTDIPAGEYVMFATAGGYFSLSSDSTGSFSSIICNDNFDYNTIITVSDGQYLEIKRACAVPIDQEGYTLETTGEGMFKVGKHIPAGEYKIIADGDGYIEVSSNSTHDFNSIVSNDNFTGEKYITVTDGQYLKLSRAHIQQ